MIKQIPNIFTLLNLFFGCCAIVCILQNGYTVSNDDGLNNLITIPSNFAYASLFIAIAAVIDFLDGFVARLMKASSELGKQLDSLADVVSFGVAPGLIIFQFLRICYAQEVDGIFANNYQVYLAFIFPCAGAYRLARFNIDNSQSTSFKGVPIPAAGLFIASFPLIEHYTNNTFILDILNNKWFWYVTTLAISYLMVSTIPMLAMKFKGINFKKLLPFIIILIASLITSFILGWVSIPVGFVVYVIVSIVFKEKEENI